MLIAIEGIDSAGKSTLTKNLTEYYQSQGKTVHFFHFPNKNSIFGQEIYRHYNQEKTYSKECMELLHTLDKMSVQEQLYEWCQEYDIVILDRYILTQYAYAIASGLNEKWIKNLISCFYVMPDFGFILDLPVEVALKRRKVSDIYEANLDFQEGVRWAFLLRGHEIGYQIIDASETPQKTYEQVIKILKKEE